jgi:hypothetical protein
MFWPVWSRFRLIWSRFGLIGEFWYVLEILRQPVPPILPVPSVPIPKKVKEFPRQPVFLEASFSPISAVGVLKEQRLAGTPPRNDSSSRLKAGSRQFF